MTGASRALRRAADLHHTEADLLDFTERLLAVLTIPEVRAVVLAIARSGSAAPKPKPAVPPRR